MESGYKHHWEKLYETKRFDEVSWAQAVPHTSLAFIQSLGITKTASIIDVGGGDSKLADFLLAEGYENITVLDIAGAALERAKKRLGNKAKMITWIETDITTFIPPQQYDVWHDRAAFHFLTSTAQVKKYIAILKQAAAQWLIMGTFSQQGPNKCSGLPIKQYSEAKLQQLLKPAFEKVNCIGENHLTPLAAKQHFLFCIFKRRLNHLNNTSVAE